MRVLKTYPMIGGSKTIVCEDNSGNYANFSCFLNKGRVSTVTELRKDGLTVMPRKDAPKVILASLEV